MSILLRYIVPFSIDDDRYDEIISELQEKDICDEKESESQKKHQKIYKWTEKSLVADDSDLLNFLIDSIKSDSEKKNIGISFALDNPYNKVCKWKYDANEIDFKIKNPHLVIFRTGIAFFCYDAVMNNEYPDDVIEMFQYKFKEIGRDFSNEFFVNEKIFDENDQFKNNTFLPFKISEWINSIINQTVTDFRYYPQRKGQKPDKALLYTCIISNKNEKYEQYKRIILGYKESYKIKDIQSFSPFSNVSWYTSREGSGVIAGYDESNKNFIQKDFITRVMTEYFVIYIIALYQSYSTLILLENISSNLSADEKYYKDKKTMEIAAETLEIIENKINVFLLKSSYTTISYIEHHNGYYNFCKKRLHINEDIDSLTDGLTALSEMQRIRKEEKEKKLNNEKEAINLIIAIFSIVSILTDGIDYINRFGIETSIITIIIIIIIVVMIHSLIVKGMK